MYPIFAVGGSPSKDKLLQKMHLLTQGNQAKPASQSSQTSDISSGPVHTPLNSAQSHAVRMLTFGSKGFKASSGIKLENEFIRTLKNSKDNTEKAGIAEILGRAHSINAIPHLLTLLDEKEVVEVRTAAAGALARIGSSTNKNSFTATELTGALLDAYQQRKTTMQEQADNPPELSFGERLDEEKNWQKRMDEIKTLATGIGQLNVVKGQKALMQEYLETLALSETNAETVKEMSRFTDLAQEQFHKGLEKRFQKPIKDILKNIPTPELDEMKKQVLIPMPDGKEINLLEALLQIAQLQDKQNQFDRQLLSGLVDALAIQNTKENNAAIKLALDNHYPDIKAKSLRILSNRNSLNYSSDIYPNLSAPEKRVRRAALQALLSNTEATAKQKTLELTSPDNFFNMMGRVTRDTMNQYVNFLEKVAENGDEYIQALSSKVLNPVYDLESRELALMTLGMMTQEPANKRVSPQTLMQAKTTIKVTALAAPARKSSEEDALSVMATQLWVETQDPDAIPVAILMADDKDRRLSGKDQERLLASVLRILHEDAKSNGKSGTDMLLRNRLVDVMKERHSPLLTEEAETEIRKTLQPDSALSRVSPKKLEDFPDENAGLDGNDSMIELLQSAVPELRPVLTRLAESEKSEKAQMIAFRIMGLLKDTESTKYLIDRVRDPLKGKIDWEADVSYKGDPGLTAANLRLNALTALGDIGDAKALDVMTDTLDDPILRNYISDPLAKIAPSANKSASAPKLNKVRTKLLKLISSPDTSRAMRATRIDAANTLYKFEGGADALKEFVAKSTDPNFKRQALSALLSNDYGLEAEHPDHALVHPLIYPGLGVEKLHAKGITGKGVELAIVDGGYVDSSNEEAFQNRVKLPAQADEPEHYHPSMVMSTAAANGKLKGVAPDAVAYSDKWPDFDSKDPMDVYKKIIEGKLRGENNIRVINNSWGFSSQNAILDKDVRELLKEYKNVVDLAEQAGIQFVFAAGNEGEEIGFPKLGTVSVFGADIDKLTSEEKKMRDYILDKVITVGAVNTQGSDKRTDHKMAEFSSVGDSLNRKLAPTVVAPGADMMVYGWDKHKGNPKQLVNGTSFASPYVTGMIALMLQKNPDLAPADIREILKKTSVKLTGVPLSHQGNGEVAPEAAVRMAETFGKTGGAKASRSRNSDEPEPPPPPPSGPKGSNGTTRRRPRLEPARTGSSFTPSALISGQRGPSTAAMNSFGAKSKKRAREESDDTPPPVAPFPMPGGQQYPSGKVRKLSSESPSPSETFVFPTIPRTDEPDVTMMDLTNPSGHTGG